MRTAAFISARSVVGGCRQGQRPRLSQLGVDLRQLRSQVIVDFEELAHVFADGGHETVASHVSHLGESVDDVADEGGVAAVPSAPANAHEIVHPTRVSGLLDAVRADGRLLLEWRRPLSCRKGGGLGW